VIHRMTAAALSLIGFFVALYLSLWKLGLMGPLVCSTGGCETVQLSQYSVLLGIPVAMYGLAGFALLFLVSIAGLQGRWMERKGPSVLLVVLSSIGVVFAAYLTYLEAAVIHAWCQWCIVCAVTIATIFIVSLAGLVRWPRVTA
jgi:uncharacterized membrane protein